MALPCRHEDERTWPYLLPRDAVKEGSRAAGYDVAKTIGMRVWGMVESKWATEHDAVIAKKVAHISGLGKPEGCV